MKKLFLTVLVSLFLLSNAFADNRIALTKTVLRAGASTLVKRGDARVYFIDFIATASNGNFIILDALTDTTAGAGSLTDIKAEGSQATSGNTFSKVYGLYPLELSTGLYVVVNNGYLVITYE